MEKEAQNSLIGELSRSKAPTFLDQFLLYGWINLVKYLLALLYFAVAAGFFIFQGAQGKGPFDEIVGIIMFVLTCLMLFVLLFSLLYMPLSAQKASKNIDRENSFIRVYEEEIHAHTVLLNAKEGTPRIFDHHLHFSDFKKSIVGKKRLFLRFKLENQAPVSILIPYCQMDDATKEFLLCKAKERKAK